MALIHYTRYFRDTVTYALSIMCSYSNSPSEVLALAQVTHFLVRHGTRKGINRGNWTWTTAEAIRDVPHGRGATSEGAKGSRAARSSSTTVRTPEHVIAKLGDAKVVMAVDLETHDWDSSLPAKGLIGQFGHYTFRDEQVLSYARIAQLGWVIGDTDATSTPWISKEYEILPIDFKISPKATQYHKITSEQAMSNGRH